MPNLPHSYSFTYCWYIISHQRRYVSSFLRRQGFQGSCPCAHASCRTYRWTYQAAVSRICCAENESSCSLHISLQFHISRNTRSAAPNNYLFDYNSGTKQTTSNYQPSV
uniref:Uncharacterized protein n=1 Tax=Anopheles dirus TaxID=7168 RepID=A0A182NX03_9DIPT